MKRILIYIVLLGTTLLMPVERSDVGKLRPIETVSVYKEKDWIVLQTDTEDVGIGATAIQALQNMKDTASGIIYLDTAEFLIIEDGAEDTAEELRQVLKGKVKLCNASREVKPMDATKYLSVHNDLPSLDSWKQGQELPVLVPFGEEKIILEKVENNA